MHRSSLRVWPCFPVGLCHSSRARISGPDDSRKGSRRATRRLISSRGESRDEETICCVSLTLLRTTFGTCLVPLANLLWSFKIQESLSPTSLDQTRYCRHRKVQDPVGHKNCLHHTTCSMSAGPQPSIRHFRLRPVVRNFATASPYVMGQLNSQKWQTTEMRRDRPALPIRMIFTSNVSQEARRFARACHTMQIRRRFPAAVGHVWRLEGLDRLGHDRTS